jgi:hypothetical protein
MPSQQQQYGQSMPSQQQQYGQSMPSQQQQYGGSFMYSAPNVMDNGSFSNLGMRMPPPLIPNGNHRVQQQGNGSTNEQAEIDNMLSSLQ